MSHLVRVFFRNNEFPNCTHEYDYINFPLGGAYGGDEKSVVDYFRTMYVGSSYMCHELLNSDAPTFVRYPPTNQVISDMERLLWPEGKPAIPFEVHQLRHIDSNAAWKAVQDFCESYRG